MNRPGLAWLGAVLVLLTQNLHAQNEQFPQSPLDVVRFGPAIREAEVDWQHNQVTSYSGKIERFDAEKLIILTANGKRTVPSKRIEQILPSWGPSASEAMNAFEGKQYQRAYDLIYATLKGSTDEELPPWKQKLVILAAVRAKSALGETRIAGMLFGRLVTSSSLPDVLYADLPLCWSTQSPSRSLMAACKEWVVSEQAALRLLGASWMLLGPDSEIAKQTLDRLAEEKSVVGTLATMQLWRTVSPPETMPKIVAWMEARDRLVPALQLGPTEFMADRLMRIGETELAIGQMLRIATEPHGRYDRARAALVRARDILTSKSLTSEAEKLEVWIKELGPVDTTP